MARTVARQRSNAVALPEWVPPQPTQLVDAAPEGDQWLHEIKFDGYRMHTRLDCGLVKLLTRTGLDWTHKYPAIAKAVASLDVRQAYLDGEIVRRRPRWHHLVQQCAAYFGQRQRGCAGLLPVRSPLPRRRGSGRAPIDQSQGASQRPGARSLSGRALSRLCGTKVDAPRGTRAALAEVRPPDRMPRHGNAFRSKAARAGFRRSMLTHTGCKILAGFFPAKNRTWLSPLW